MDRKNAMEPNHDALEEEIFGLISHGGNARALAYEALEHAEKFDFTAAEKVLKLSDKEIKVAHKIQTKLIQRELNGQNYSISLLLIHAQDHFMTALSERNLIEHFIKLYKYLNGK